MMIAKLVSVCFFPHNVLPPSQKSQLIDKVRTIRHIPVESLESSWQACFYGTIALHQFSISHRFKCSESFWGRLNFVWANVLN